MSPFKDDDRRREYQRLWRAAKRADAKAATQIETPRDRRADQPTGRPVLSASDRTRIDDLRKYIKGLESGNQKGQADQMRKLSQTYSEIADRIEAELITAIENARAELLSLTGSKI